MDIVKELPEFRLEGAIYKRRRLVILRRDDGLFSIAEQYYYRSEYNGSLVAAVWATVRTEGIFENAALAEASAMTTVSSMRS